MNKLALTLLAGLFISHFAVADSGCAMKAAEKKLAGAAKTSFLTKCEADAKSSSAPVVAPAKAPGCASQAGEKKLAGAAKTSFMKKCEADAKTSTAPAALSMTPTCAQKAAEKKLHGAAEASFMKKCEADAKKG